MNNDRDYGDNFSRVYEDNEVYDMNNERECKNCGLSLLDDEKELCQICDLEQQNIALSQTIKQYSQMVDDKNSELAQKDNQINDLAIENLALKEENEKLLNDFIHYYKQSCTSDFKILELKKEVERLEKANNDLINDTAKAIENYDKLQKQKDLAVEDSKRAIEYAQRALNWIEKDNCISAKLVLRKIIKNEKLAHVILDTTQALNKIKGVE